MATLTPIATLPNLGNGIASIQAALSAAADLSNDFANDGNIVLFVHNGDAATKDVTLVAEPDPYGRGGSGNNDVTVTIPAGETAFFPFMAAAMFNSGGSATFTLSAITSVDIGIYRLTKSR